MIKTSKAFNSSWFCSFINSDGIQRVQSWTWETICFALYKLFEYITIGEMSRFIDEAKLLSEYLYSWWWVLNLSCIYICRSWEIESSFFCNLLTRDFGQIIAQPLGGIMALELYQNGSQVHKAENIGHSCFRSALLVLV